MTFEQAKNSKRRVKRACWDEDEFIRFKELDPTAWDTNDYPPDRGRWDPVAEHNCCFTSEDEEATDWEFWEDPVDTMYRESLVEALRERKDIK